MKDDDVCVSCIDCASRFLCHCKRGNYARPLWREQTALGGSDKYRAGITQKAARGGLAQELGAETAAWDGATEPEKGQGIPPSDAPTLCPDIS